MHIMLTPGEATTVATRSRREAMPWRRPTTLDALMAALQAVVAPEDDALMVATVVHLLRSRRLTWTGPDHSWRRA
jgi:hypothetical protein